MKVTAIVQARTGSTRLPRKVLMELSGRTVLSHVIERVKACPEVDEVVIATTILPADDAIVREADRCGVRWFRGSEEDVLERYFLAARECRAEIVVRITSDCPLIDPILLGGMIREFKERHRSGHPVDYLSNCLERTYPRGLDAEIFTFSALEKTYLNAVQPEEREHVTPYMHRHPELFSLHGVKSGIDRSRYRWTLDTPEDYELILEIYRSLYREGRIFTTDEVLDLLSERPGLLEINVHVRQKELTQ
jgi:spore coat polysaccharide biosynthesis protein SpsF